MMLLRILVTIALTSAASGSVACMSSASVADGRAPLGGPPDADRILSHQPTIDGTPAPLTRAGAASPPPLSPSESAWLAQLPTLRMGIDPGGAPLSFIGRDGEPVGLAMDHLDDALLVLGVRTIPVHTADWAETVKRASAGEIDLLAAASPRNDALAKDFEFTDAYVEFPVMIVTRENTATIAGPADLGGRRIAANMAQGAVALPPLVSLPPGPTW